MKTTITIVSLSAILAGLCFAGAITAPAASPAKPNIIIFLADDLGYADLGVQGCQDVPTPHVDSLAKNGIRFTDGYANHCVCSPSRAALMSGRYQHRFGFEHNSGPERFADPNFGLPRTEKTLAERLKELGYATGMAGKWHIGFKEGLRPHERGFDYHFGFLSGAHTYLPGKRDNDPLLRNGVPVTDEKEYLTDAFAREAVAFLERSQAKPWFLYLAFNAVHSPLDENSYMARFPNLTGNRRIYAGMLTALDVAVGRVLDKVRQLGQEDNTLIFFYSDNGGPTSQTTSRNAPLRGYKGQMLEGGIRIPFLAQWKGHLPSGKVYAEPVMAFDIHATALLAAGGTLPVEKPLDGVDLLPFLTGAKPGPPHEKLCWRAEEQWAVRLGDWKMFRAPGGEPALYNLRSDIGEATDLAAKEPAKFKELKTAYDAWAKEMMPPQWVRQDQRNAEAGGKKKAPGAGAVRGQAGGQLEQRFKELDKDGDGKVSRQEGGSLPFFDAADKNKDGFLTLEEVQNYFRSRRSSGAKAQP